MCHGLPKRRPSTSAASTPTPARFRARGRLGAARLAARRLRADARVLPRARGRVPRRSSAAPSAWHERLAVPFMDLHLAEESAAVREAIDARDRPRLVRARARGRGVRAGVRGRVRRAARRRRRQRHRRDRARSFARSASARATRSITTPLSAAYTALAIVMAGARPVFADIDPERLTLDPAAAERAITSRDGGAAARASVRPARRHAGARGARQPQGPRARRGLLPGASGDVRGPAGRHVRRRGRVQLLSHEESRRARRRRRGRSRATRRSPSA